MSRFLTKELEIENIKLEEVLYCRKDVIIISINDTQVIKLYLLEDYEKHIFLNEIAIFEYIENKKKISLSINEERFLLKYYGSYEITSKLKQVGLDSVTMILDTINRINTNITDKCIRDKYNRKTLKVYGIILERLSYTLKDYLEETIPIPINIKEFDIISQLLVIVLVFRKLKIHHRDIKPSNIGISSDFKTVKLFDFDVSKIGDSDFNVEEWKLGTPIFKDIYYWFEIITYNTTNIQSNFSYLSDLWSIGIIIILLLMKKSRDEKVIITSKRSSIHNIIDKNKGVEIYHIIDKYKVKLTELIESQISRYKSFSDIFYTGTKHEQLINELLSIFFFVLLLDLIYDKDSRTKEFSGFLYQIFKSFKTDLYIHKNIKIIDNIFHYLLDIIKDSGLYELLYYFLNEKPENRLIYHSNSYINYVLTIDRCLFGTDNQSKLSFSVYFKDFLHKDDLGFDLLIRTSNNKNYSLISQFRIKEVYITNTNNILYSYSNLKSIIMDSTKQPICEHMIPTIYAIQSIQCKNKTTCLYCSFNK